MKLSVKSWLAQQLARVDSVQRCVPGRDADIIVYSWRGIIIHVHLVDAPIKPRLLKRIVQEATRVGIGSLFVVDAALLPPDGARVIPAEWLMAVYALTDDKLYAYRIDKGEPGIFQVHFRVTTKGDERDVWYGPDVQIGKLPFFRVWVKTPASMKGDYLVANFAADPFWHNRDYRHARMAADEKRRAAHRGERRSYEFGYGSVPTEVIPHPLTRLERCYKELGLAQGASCDEVKGAFRRLALEIHPDVSALPKEEAESRFRALSDAYNYIRENDGCS